MIDERIYLYIYIYIYIFFFNDTATTEIYTLSLHDALPISLCGETGAGKTLAQLWMQSLYGNPKKLHIAAKFTDRKSTRLNSSHKPISYSVFCLKKKNSTTLLYSFILLLLHDIRISYYAQPLLLLRYLISISS